MRIFMMAVHRTLVKFESAMLASLGHEVFTIHDLEMDLRGYGHSQANAIDALPEQHPCVKRPLRLPLETVFQLKRIDMGLGSFGSLKSYLESVAALVGNFDALYIQMVPAWLMVYGAPMLANGKKVFLRVFGHPFSELGCPGIGNEQVLEFADRPGMYLLPVLETEAHMWQWFPGKTRTVMAAVCGDLVVKPYMNPDGIRRRGVLSVGGYFDKNPFQGGFERRGLDWRHVDCAAQFVSDAEMAGEYARRRVYADLCSGPNIIKYSPCEAISQGMPALIYCDSGQAAEMRHDGVPQDLPFIWTTVEEMHGLAARYCRDEGEAVALADRQRHWLDAKQAKAMASWREMLG